MSGSLPANLFGAPPQEDLRDEIARILDPHSWMLRERALMPYREKRGSHDLENWIYQVTYRKGFRYPEEIDEWLRHGQPLPADQTQTFHLAFQDSLRRADAVIAMMRDRSLLAT